MCSGAAAAYADSAADGNSKRHPEKQKKKKNGVPRASISFRVDRAADNLSSAKGRQEVSVSVNGMSDVTVPSSPSCRGQKKKKRKKMRHDS